MDVSPFTFMPSVARLALNGEHVMPRQRLYTRDEVKQIIAETIRRTAKALNRRWKTFMKRLLKDNHNGHTKERLAMMNAWLDAESRLHHRRKRTADTIKQDAEMFEMRKRKKLAAVASHYGISQRSVLRACRRHEQTTGEPNFAALIEDMNKQLPDTTK
jgi:hypothetical protein